MTEHTETTNATPVGDLQTLKSYALGTLAFGTAVTTFLTQAFHTPLEATLLATTGVGIFFLIIVFLIHHSEQRSKARLVKHMEASDKVISDFHKDIAILKELAIETQRSSLRTEMDNEIHRNPSNHDTIIKYAYKYFRELNGDWVETEKFLAWVDAEKEQGRIVHLPPELLHDIDAKAAIEKQQAAEAM